MTKYIFIPACRLKEIDNIEIRHYKPDDDKSIEAFDVRFMKKGYLDIELDLPIPLVKKLLKRLLDSARDYRS